METKYWYSNDDMMLSRALSEDVSAPELRNPKNSAIKAEGWLARLLRRVSG